MHFCGIIEFFGTLKITLDLIKSRQKEHSLCIFTPKRKFRLLTKSRRNVIIDAFLRHYPQDGKMSKSRMYAFLRSYTHLMAESIFEKMHFYSIIEPCDFFRNQKTCIFTSRSAPKSTAEFTFYAFLRHYTRLQSRWHLQEITCDSIPVCIMYAFLSSK